MEAQPGEVWELDETGSRLLHRAGSPEAAAFSAKYGDPEHPVALTPPLRLTVEADGSISKISGGPLDHEISTGPTQKD